MKSLLKEFRKIVNIAWKNHHSSKDTSPFLKTLWTHLRDERNELTRGNRFSFYNYLKKVLWAQNDKETWGSYLNVKLDCLQWVSKEGFKWQWKQRYFLTCSFTASKPGIGSFADCAWKSIFSWTYNKPIVIRALKWNNSLFTKIADETGFRKSKSEVLLRHYLFWRASYASYPQNSLILKQLVFSCFSAKKMMSVLRDRWKTSWWCSTGCSFWD